MSNLQESIKVGEQVNWGDTVYEIRAIVDDKHVVTRTWHDGMWHYNVLSADWVDAA